MGLDDLQVSRELSSLRSQVTDRLRQAILSGRFGPGTKLNERELCEMLGVSRTVLREALQHLTAEGLITSVPHKGLTVATIDAEEVREIYQVREQLEALAGEGFARYASDEDMHRLRGALVHLNSAEASATTQNLLEAKNRFYEILLEGCGNRVVGLMLTQLNNRITMLRRMSLSHPGRLVETLRELEAIVAALEARDAERARALCASHVRNASEVVARRFAAT